MVLMRSAPDYPPERIHKLLMEKKEKKMLEKAQQELLEKEKKRKTAEKFQAFLKGLPAEEQEGIDISSFGLDE